MAAVIVGGVNSGRAMWSRVRYDDGSQVMISMARGEAVLFLMKWGGLIPGRRLVTLDAVALVTPLDLWNATPLQRSQAILAHLTAAILPFSRAAEVEAAFNDSQSPYPHKAAVSS